MLKLRLTRIGRKKQPVYRLVIMEHTTRRDGRPIEQLGFYNPLTKESSFQVEKIQKWLSSLGKGVIIVVRTLITELGKILMKGEV